MNNVSMKTILHTIAEAPLPAALRTYEQHSEDPRVAAAMSRRALIEANMLQRRVVALEHQYNALKELMLS